MESRQEQPRTWGWWLVRIFGVIGVIALIVLGWRWIVRFFATAATSQVFTTCKDGWASASQCRRGTCSWHGGVDQWGAQLA